MSTPLNLKIDPEKVHEIPMVDLAFMVLKAANTPFYYRDLMNEVAKLRGLSEEEINDVIAQLYTEINIDGRFACVGTNLWGLKRWYPVDKSEDAITGGKRPRIINDEDDEEEDYQEEEEENYDTDDDFGDVDDSEDAEDEDLFDADDDDDTTDDVVLDDEDLEEEEAEEESEDEPAEEEDY
ncbi:DNA-directed RNA polymerase subunit delta [Paenibacillus sp. P96]|uniref:Probable DNA-directed RNA polymerase subunit delta n=1 Tax=Paenibacillus zeirhizosphaerae TaxID=2987519 RepID=A0ABT9FWW7_9BACL|nr:DNA-directed RNA polymerase subunit delta [Paenibacillus sp. P96]MDP4099226.1 DNA-directed RNA polymerase subunit delta [Paenibacillus sp. P96]